MKWEELKLEWRFILLYQKQKANSFHSNSGNWKKKFSVIKRRTGRNVWKLKLKYIKNYTSQLSQIHLCDNQFQGNYTEDLPSATYNLSISWSMWPIYYGKNNIAWISVLSQVFVLFLTLLHHFLWKIQSWLYALK